MKHFLWLPTVALVVGIGLGAALFPTPSTSATSGLRLSDQISGQSLTEIEQAFANVYNNVAPSVVSITVSEQVGARRLANTATGSGFVLDTLGHIVTNYHVVQNAARIVVQMFDGTITRAEVVGLDADSDIAVLRINVPRERLRPVTFGNSDTLQIGQMVLALGNPFQNNWTLTSGIVSAVNRRIFGLNSYSVGGVIQTDAAINPGNSGGPLLNLRGEVIGINSQIATETGSNQGVGFAVPSNLVVKVVNSLIETGRMRYSFMGLTSRAIDIDLIETFNLPNNIRGVAVLDASRGLPAANAGLRPLSSAGVDIITAIDGVPINDFDQLIGWLAINTTPGQTVNLTVYRDGQYFNAPLTLTERPSR